MKPKITFATLASVAILAATTMPIAYASTASPKMTKAKIILNGAMFSEPYKFVGGNPQTTYMPIYYVQQLINKALNIQSSADMWNGNLKTWKLSVSNKTTKVISNGSGTAIYINGTVIEDAPTKAAVDPSSGKPTTFMPIWYVQQLLNQVLGLNSTTDVWDGSASTPTWTITTQASATSTGSGTSTTTSTGTSTTLPTDSQLQAQAKALYDQITWKVEGSYRVFTAPLKLYDGPWEFGAGNATDTVQYSNDNGQTWHTPNANYDTYDLTQGGLRSAPAGVSHVLFRVPKNQTAIFNFTRVGKHSNASIGKLSVDGQGAKTLTLKVIGNFTG